MSVSENAASPFVEWDDYDQSWDLRVPSCWIKILPPVDTLQQWRPEVYSTSMICHWVTLQISQGTSKQIQNLKFSYQTLEWGCAKFWEQTTVQHLSCFHWNYGMGISSIVASLIVFCVEMSHPTVFKRQFHPQSYWLVHKDFIFN